MFNYVLHRQALQHDFLHTFLCMLYIMMILSSILLFGIILKINILGIHVILSGAIIPYVFLYPISFILLRLYGVQSINNTIGSAILVTFIFVLISKIITAVSYNHSGINEILSSSLKMYLAGLIGMPAGMYTSFLVINKLIKQGFSFNGITLAIATAVGEIVNTVIVFPIGLSGSLSFSEIFNQIITDALIFKIGIGVVLAFVSIPIINGLINKKINVQ